MNWMRHDLQPWARMKGDTAEHGLHLGGESWIIVRKSRHPDTRCICWMALWGPAGFRGIHPHIVVILFTTKRLAAVKALCELWASTRPEVTP